MLWTNNSNWFWDPWEEFDKMHRAFQKVGRHRSSEFPAVNTWVSSDKSVLTAEIPGVDPKEINISVHGKTVTLEGVRRAEDLGKERKMHRNERWSGEFSKEIELPFTIESEKVTAKYSNGVLNLTLPRAESEKPRKIEITNN